MVAEGFAGSWGRLRAEDDVYTSFPSADSVIVRDLFDVGDVAEGSTLGASTECTPRVHPCTDELWTPKCTPKTRIVSCSTYGDGHKLVKVQNRLIDRVAARPRLEAFMEYLSSKVVRRRGSDAHDTYRSTRVVDTNVLCIICNIELFSTALTRTARHYLIFYLSESYSIAKMGKK